MAGQVVHDHDVARPELGDEHLTDIGVEGVAIDRSIEHHGRDQAGAAQARDEGGGLPVPERHARAQPFSAPATTVAAGHVGRCPGLVDEDQLVGVEVELAVEPGPAPFYDVGTVLLGRVACLFLRVIRWRERNRHSVAMLVLTPCPASIVRSSSSVMSDWRSMAAWTRAA